MRWIVQGILVLTLALTLVYGLASNFDFLFEDQSHLAAFPRQPSPEDYHSLWRQPTSCLERTWRPIAQATLLVQRGASGLQDAWPYRLFNVFLLGLAGVLAGALFRLPPFEFRRIPLILGMLGWVFHPTATGTIYRIVAGREVLLMTVFALASLLLYFRGGFFPRIGALLFFGLALGSHEMAWTLPLLIAAGEGIKLSTLPSRREEFRRDSTPLEFQSRFYFWMSWFWVGAFFVLLGFYFIFRIRVLEGMEMEWRPERMPWRSFLYGVQTTFLPFREVLHQPTWPVWWSGWRLFGALWMVAGLIALCVFCLFRTDLTPMWGRSEERRRLLFWAIWFFLWAPSLATAWTSQPAFDELNVWPASLAVFGVLAWVGTRVWSEIAFRQEGWVLGISLIVVLMAMSFSRRVEHRSDSDYVAHWGRRDPGAAVRLEQQGQAFSKKGQWEEAELRIRRALMLKPEDRALQRFRRDALVRRGRLEEALVLARDIAREGEDADRELLADLLMEAGRVREASDLYTILLEKSPDSISLRQKLERALSAEQEAPASTPPPRIGESSSGPAG